MKRVALLLYLSLATTAALANTAPLYVKEIIASDGGAIAKNAISIIRSSQIRLHYASAFGFPTLQQYIKEKTSEGMSEQEISELYTSMYLTSELQDYEIEAALTNNSELRAGVISSAYLAAKFLDVFMQTIGASNKEDLEEYLEKAAKQPVSFEQFLSGALTASMNMATGLTMIFAAADSPDKNLEELISDLSDIQLLKFDIEYSDAYSNRIQGDDNPIPADSASAYAVSDGSNVLGGTIGDYLRRTNHVTPAVINDAERKFLTGIGITDEEIFAMMPTGLPRFLADTTMSGIPILGDDPNLVGELDYAIVIDLINEAGSLHPLKVTSQIIYNQREYGYFKKFLEEELEYLDVSMEELVSALRHPERPSSLFQVLQALHKGFSLEEIDDLEYETLDAIIISNIKDKEELFTELEYAVDMDKEVTIAYLNEFIRSKGQLTLALLDQGYDIDSIPPHFVPKRTRSDNKDEATNEESKGGEDE